MIVEPKIRGFICTTAHPEGCARHVQEQIDYVRALTPLKRGPKKALIIGSSNGYGLSSRVVASFGGTAASTIGIFFERPSDGRRTATAGWYNSVAFEEKARAEGIYAKSINGDAFSDEVKAQTIEMIKADLSQIDLLIYSLASPRRKHPRTGKLSKSTLKPIGKSYTNISIDMSRDKLETVTLEAATEEEVQDTVEVMGGEDWKMWIDALEKADCLAPGFMTVAYSYVGPELTRPVYREGTIGRAKDHLEQTAKDLDGSLKSTIDGSAFISVNKALVTQSSSAIPFIPLYFILLSKVLKEKSLEEDCVAQIGRLFHEHLYGPDGPQLDDNGLIRLDDRELRKEVQDDVMDRWNRLKDENLYELSDLKGHHIDFLKLFGFEFPDVDYQADIEIERPLPSSRE